LLVPKAFHLAQNQGGALFERQVLKSRLQPRAQLLSSELAIRGRRLRREDHLSVFTNVLVERDLIRPRAPAPPPLAIAGLVHDGAEDPGPERRLPAEPVERSENAKEHFLREIEGVLPVPQQVGRQAQDQTVVLEDQRRVSGLITGQTALDQG